MSCPDPFGQSSFRLGRVMGGAGHMASAHRNQGQRRDQVFDLISKLEPHDATRTDTPALQPGNAGFHPAHEFAIAECQPVRHDSDSVAMGRQTGQETRLIRHRPSARRLSIL
ncbi:MAG: hypothetical protein BGO83_19085 [Devosia sp. 66-14]|nr:MAG: hypothetical protein ABS47_14705 [Devosia sp. SCN 66-27]OJX22876.1 MAG: hypothetical protein BGO83_19085 [Devosia sp. 66-14]